MKHATRVQRLEREARQKTSDGPHFAIIWEYSDRWDYRGESYESREAAEQAAYEFYAGDPDHVVIVSFDGALKGV